MDIRLITLLTVLFIPVVMIVVGKFYSNKVPGKINYFVGYRTTRSMKNDETWEFAHKKFSKIWYKWGLIMLPLSILTVLFVISKNEDIIEVMGAIITVVQLLPILASIALTEKALKDNFDEEGNRK